MAFVCEKQILIFERVGIIVKWTMCDINCIWLFNLLVAFVLIIQQQQHHAVATGLKQEQSPYADITSYASALATKYLHQHSWPKANVVKREIKNDKNTDFITYLSGK